MNKSIINNNFIKDNKMITLPSHINDFNDRWIFCYLFKKRQMKIIKKIFLIFIFLKFLKINKKISFKDLNFKKLDFTNYKQIKSFIFKTNFYRHENKYVQSFEFLNFSQKLGGKIGINLSKQSILGWYF